MKVNHIKQLFVALFLLLSAGTATAAQWKLAKTNLNAAGSKDTLTLKVSDNTVDFSSFQVDFTLPAGVLLSGTPILGELADDHALTWSKRADGSFRCVVYSVRNTEMKAPGAVLRIPVELAVSFVEGTFTAKNGLLSDKASKGQPVTDLTATLTSHKEKAKLVVNVSGLEQVVNTEKAAVLDCKTIPATLPDGKTLTIGYYKDEKCTEVAGESDRKQEGIFFVKVSYPEDAEYEAFEQIYTMSLTSKKAIAEGDITPPTAASIKAGQSLSTSLLSGGSVTDEGYLVAGTFAWTYGNTVVPAGTHEYSVTFYPDNSSYYNTAALSVAVKVDTTYKVTAVQTTGGAVNVLGKAEDNVYVKGQKISLVATPLPNYQLSSWSIAGESVDLGKKDTLTVTVGADRTYSANFTPILHKVSIETFGDASGDLKVTTPDDQAADGQKPVSNGDELQQGSILQIAAIPSVNTQLKSLQINGESLKGDKVTLTGPLTIKAVFEPKPVNMALVTLEKKNMEHGSILLYKEDGTLITSGSTVAVGSKIRVISLPDAGYKLEGNVGLSGVTGPGTDNLCAVTGDITLVNASFVAKGYAVTASAVSSNPSQTASGTITLSKEGEDGSWTEVGSGEELAYGTRVRIAKAEGQAGASLLTILANSKEISQSDILTVTGPLTVTAVFDHRVKIKREYIFCPYQEYYYSGVSRPFTPFASQTYAGFSFDVKYKINDGEETSTAIDAGDYTVVLRRAEDGLYEAFEEIYPDPNKPDEGRVGLKIKKSKVTITKAPTSHGANPGTRPGTEFVNIISETKDNVTTYKITPKGDALKNYEGTTIYYYSTNPVVNFSLGNSTPVLRSSNGSQPEGVRITNGGLPCDLNDIRAGVTITLEAVAPVGQHFVEWSDKNSDNPRVYQVTGDGEIYPIYAPKDEYPACTLAKSSEYNGMAQTVEVKGSDTSCVISFYQNEEDCNAEVNKVPLKNPGTYYVRVDRPEDKTYKSYTKVFTYEITLGTPTVTWPAASDILSGQKLSESVLQGGHAGIVAGTFAWSDPDKEITEKGMQEIAFTPTDPNYKPVSSKIEVKVVSSTSSSTDPETPVIPVDPVDPENPDVPTGVESIEEGMSLYTANQSIFVDMPQEVALKVVDVAGIVIFEGKVCGKMEIPVGHAGVYFLKCTAPDASFVKKVVVR